MPTAILIDPFEGVMNSLPSTLKDIFKKIVQKLKSLYKGLIGEFNNRNFAPRTLEDAVLSIYQDGNTYTATDNLNQRVRYVDEEIEEELRQKYSEKFIKSTNKQVASEEETRIIKEIIQSYPKHQVANGVEMLDGLQNDNHDMPMQEEYLTARLTKELLGKDLILLPRYMDRFLNEIAGYQRFDNYSLSDGISALAEDGRTYEFKFTNSFGKVRNKLKKATEKADVAVVVISTPINLNRLENMKFESNSESYVINVYNPQEIEIANKKASNEWRVYTDTKSELKPEISSSIINIASELREVNPQDQTTMDYSVYSSNGESVKDISSSQSKYNSVRKKYYGTSEWLKAPNGKATKLTEEQWIQVRTPNFIKWFGDWINDPDNASKVVDENGEPLAVYHTTNADFDTFKVGERAGLSGKGIYFAIGGQGVPSYGSNTIKAFLNIRNPLTRELLETDMYSSINNNGNSAIQADVFEKYPEFDGVMVRRDEITVKDPNQIKSATENNGDFSIEDTRFRYSEELDDNDTQDYGDTFNVDNPKSIINRNIRTWEALVDSDAI